MHTEDKPSDDTGQTVTKKVLTSENLIIHLANSAADCWPLLIINDVPSIKKINTLAIASVD